MAKNKVSQKKNLSSIQVIKTLQILMQGTFSINDLVAKLNENEKEAVFNNSVISKYINTCRFCGFEIPKINNAYYVAKIPFGLDLSMDDIDLLKSIQHFINEEMSSKSAQLINSVVKKICMFSNKKISKTEKNGFNLSVELFERAIAQQRKIKLIFKNRSEMECVPLSITKEGYKTFFNVFYKKIRNIDVARLSGIEISGQKSEKVFGLEQVTVFKLKGKLAKRYEAREHERIDTNPDGTITVTNTNENKEILMSRLLRYEEDCEIVHPLAYRENMKNIINDMLNNYGVS